MVSQKFIEHLFLANFDYSEGHAIIHSLQAVYKGRTFDKAMEALIAVVN